jgi:hypothetical protein
MNAVRECWASVQMSLKCGLAWSGQARVVETDPSFIAEMLLAEILFLEISCRPDARFGGQATC